MTVAIIKNNKTARAKNSIRIEQRTGSAANVKRRKAMKQRTHSILIVLAVVALAGGKRVRQSNNSKPNVIWFFADDYDLALPGFQDAGYRNSAIHTPNIDKLVGDGISFTNAYSSQQCSPSRSSFLSGRYPYKSGMQHGVISDEGPNCMDLKFKFLSDYLKDLNYNTHAVGKWHLGYCNKKCTPTYRGFDTFSGGYSGEGDYYEHTTHGGWYDWHNGTETDLTAAGVHSQDLVEADMMKNLDENDGTPFFYYTAFHNTHSPLQPKPEHKALYNDMDATPSRKKYLGLVSGMDAVIGNVVAKLKAKGMFDNTYIFFSSDNGGDVNEGDNSPWRGAKSSLFEGGCHAHSWASSPLIRKKGVEADGLLHMTDWLPTILTLAGGTVPDGIDGIEQVDLITNAGLSKRTNMIYNIDMELETGPPNFGCMAARDLRYKLIWGFEGRSDGYGVDADFIYNHDRVVDLVEEEEFIVENVDKRGGPYPLSHRQHRIFSEYVSLTTVTMADVQAGTGPMMLFDLQEDPNETTDLIESQNPEHIAAKESLIHLLRNAINSEDYYVSLFQY
ncbi:hypothetical protein CAPTEDRAFT_208054 [Capitella teleta]|uniref:Sulfatase N-terminal domain-containing protein n=1 Tax=Capitella teleta TaxID=283909 RepID=R7U8G9_CAPTE|nr:hypothetical protein CAPTEDRAFT_208054 [Capitella teleta]|eukprot:ELT99395.1 hypothetical protein CAPTEDRAFT_208054 [Capitella teleta]